MNEIHDSKWKSYLDNNVCHPWNTNRQKNLAQSAPTLENEQVNKISCLSPITSFFFSLSSVLPLFITSYIS